jgi:hypothetical protein
MKQNQEVNPRLGDNLSKEKANGGFKKKSVNPDEAPKKQQTPNEEVPNIGDHQKKGPIVAPTPESVKDKEITKEEKQA